MSWKEKFRLVGIKPGVVIFPTYGHVDFARDDLDEGLVDKIYSSGCPYLRKKRKKKTDKEKES